MSIPVDEAKKLRSSNLELYRIVCMLMIVAHHYVVNSGLTSDDGPLLQDVTSRNSIFLTVFGAWGKTGINCFLMITGYYMCTSKISTRKFLKLILQVYLYKVLIFFIFLWLGYESISGLRLVKLIMPFWGISDGFVTCFIPFWLSIPFLSILVHNMSQRQHQLLLLLFLGIYSVLGSIPTFGIRFNYITWFSIIFFVASYIRLYPSPIYDRPRLWGGLTLLFLLLAISSIFCLRLFLGIKGMGYNFVYDCNKIFTLLIAITSFIWFKNLKIKYSKIINAFGAGTFGVLLIHANSDAMRTWLWKDVVDSVGHYYTMQTGSLILYSVGVVFAIFFICNLIDQLRIATLENMFFRWYDKMIAVRMDHFMNKILK